MRIRLVSIGASVGLLSVLAALAPTKVTVADDAAATAAGAVLKTPWGEPDLQGIWTDETDTPLQRPAKYANQEFFTEAQRAELDEQRAELFGRDPHGERGTELDVAGAYSFAVFLSTKIVVMSPRPGRIIDLIACDFPRDRTLDFRDTTEFIAVAHRGRHGLRAGHSYDE